MWPNPLGNRFPYGNPNMNMPQMNAMAALQQQAMQHSQHQMAFMQMQQQNIPLPPGPAPPLPPGPAPTSSISSIPTPTTSISAAAATQPPLPPGPPPPASNQNNQYNQVAPPTSFAQNQYQGFHPRDPHQMRGGRQQHQPNRGGRGGRMDGPRPLMPYDDWHENPNPNANRGGGRGGGFGDRGGFGRGGFGDQGGFGRNRGRGGDRGQPRGGGGMFRGGRGGDSGRGFGGNRGGPGGRRNQDEEMGDPNNPNNAPLGPRPSRPTFGGPQSSDQAPLLPDQCRSGSAPKPLLPVLSGPPGQSDSKQQTPKQQQDGGGGRPGDWICNLCNKNNFSRRTDCFSCKASKQEATQQQNNTNRNQGGPNQDSSGRPYSDWNCAICNKMNFARRTDCFGCRAPKQVAPSQMPPDAQTEKQKQNFQQPPRPQQQNNWQQNQQQQYSNDPSRDEGTTSSAFSSPSKAQLTKQLEQFEPMFSNWEKQFEEWKQQNRNNPDQAYVRDYIGQMNAMRERLVDRRKTLQTKIDAFSQPNKNSIDQDPNNSSSSEKPTPGSASSEYGSSEPSTSSSSSLARPTPKVQDSISDIVKAALENSKALGGKPKYGAGSGPLPKGHKDQAFVDPSYSKPKSPAQKVSGEPEIVNLDSDDEDTKKKNTNEEITIFSVKSSSNKSSGGIPGLGDGEDTEKVKEKTEQPSSSVSQKNNLSEEDRQRIAKVITADEEDDDQDDEPVVPQKKFKSNTKEPVNRPPELASNDFLGRKKPNQQGRGGGLPPPRGQPEQSRVQQQQQRANSWQDRRPICRFYVEGKCHKDPCNFKHEGEPRNKPKFVISRNDFSNKIDDEDLLFERRDPKEIPSWNPSTATVVDYGHGTGSSNKKDSMSNILEQAYLQNQDANPGGSSDRHGGGRENPLFQPISRDYGVIKPPGADQQQEDFYSRPHPADLDRYSRSQERDPYSSRFEESRNNPYQSNIRSQEQNYLREESYMGSNRIPDRDPYPTQTMYPSRSLERVDPYMLPTHQDREPHSLSRERDVIYPRGSQERDTSRSMSLERQDFGSTSSSSRYDSFTDKPHHRNPDPPMSKSQFPVPFGPSKAAIQSQSAKPQPLGETLAVDDLIQPPGRYMRPPKIVVIFRGLPGSGKSYVAKNVKSQESEFGSETPRILALDDYFECDGEYEYEAELEDTYRASLIKSFKKQIDDGYFSFIMVDCINNLTKHYEEMWSYAKQKGFEVYIAEVECDVSLAVTRNIHGWTEEALRKLNSKWESTPDHYNKLDLRGFLQDKEITQVEMEDAEPDPQEDLENFDDEDEAQDPTTSGSFQLSKWELMDKDIKMAQLDGVSKKAIKRLADHHSSINDWLELSDDSMTGALDKNGKKRVRWADLEERKEQVKMREIGFVVGQTNWNRMMDPTAGSSALTRTKIIPNRYQTH